MSASGYEAAAIPHPSSPLLTELLRFVRGADAFPAISFPAGALVVPLPLALLWWRFPRAGVIFAVGLALLFHITIALAALTALFKLAEAATRDLVAAQGGRITLCQDDAQVRASRSTLIEYCWNHTTLQALKVDPTLTYIQARFDPARQREQVLALHASLSPEVMLHLEFIRLTDGRATCSSLPIVKFSTEERLQQLCQAVRDQGCTINDAHVYVLEDGGKLRDMDRSEERRVGKECRSRWSPYH